MIATNDTAEAVYGLDLPQLSHDISMAKVRKSFQQDEVSLYHSKWFDYRFLNPTQASYVYAQEWVKAYKQAFKIHVDRDGAQYSKPMRHEDLFDNTPQFYSGIWRGRQFADGLGMPYDFYITQALHQRLRRWRQQFLPRPHQLYFEAGKDEDDMRQSWFLADMERVWKDKQHASFVYSQHQNYKNDRYKGMRHQNDHHEWLINQVNLRDNPAPLLARLLDENMIPYEKVQARFDPMIVDRVRNYTAITSL
jgi:hypothetical protein